MIPGTLSLSASRTLDAYLKSQPNRCKATGADLATQHGPNRLCQCAESPADEWDIFTTALRSAAAKSPDGHVHQADVRPLIRGAIEPKRIGLCWRRARRERLVLEVGHERSDDEQGKNAGRMEPYYELRAA